MNSISAECQELKEVYDACFLSWFSGKFLKGKSEDECAPLFVQYQKCVKKAVKELDINIPSADKLRPHNIDPVDKKERNKHPN
jgi:TRIAP1/MDM35 family protein